MRLIDKIKNRTSLVGIIGLGYVGLPLSRAFTTNNFKVLGFDIDEEKITNLSNQKSYLSHIPDSDIEKMFSNNLFCATSDFSQLKKVDVIIICVPTPLTKNKKPDLSPVLNTAKIIKKYLRKEQLVILESSTYPGTTDEDLRSVLDESGLKKDEDYFLSYSPEREDPGNIDFNTSVIPKIVGADNEEARNLAKTLYESVISEVVVVNSSKVAEAAKLTENIFRSVNIAMVNELKVIYDEMGIDVWDVIQAASTKPFGYMPFYPGPGLGGHCIPIDPFYLSFKAKEFGINTRFIELAGEINTNMPRLVINKLSDAISLYLKKSINGSKILIVGMAYKKDIDDMRESPSLTLLELLESKGAFVDYHDNFVKLIPKTREHINLFGRKSVEIHSKNLKKYDAILISTDHSYIDYQMLGDNSNLIVDTRNVMSKYAVTARVIKA